MLVPSLIALLAADLPKVDVEEMLRRPRSPATVASLIQRREDPRILREWGEALSDPRPEVRAAAARAIHAAGALGLASRINEALATETTEVAAIEEVRALAGLGNAEQIRTIPTSALRLSAAGQAVAALALGRRLGPSALSALPGFWDLDLGDEKGLVAVVTARRPDQASALPALSNVRARPRLLSAALSACRELRVTVAWPVIQEVLSDARAEIRGVAAWHLVLSAPGDVPDEIQQAFASAPEARGRGTDPETVLGFELLGRRLGHPRTDASDRLATLYREGNSLLPLSTKEDEDQLAMLLTPDESKILASVQAEATGRESGPSHFLKSHRQGFRPSKGQAEPMRTLDDVGLIVARDAAQVFGCDTTQGQRAYGALITFGPDARPLRTSLMAMDFPNDPCTRAAFIALINSLAPPDHEDFASAEPLVIFLPLEKQFLACPRMGELRKTGAITGVSSHRIRVGGKIKEPRKLIDVRPSYPDYARQNGIAGIVVAEATISVEGCVADLKLLTSPHHSLSWAALRAVAGWKYTPTLLDGEPVPVIMTVTVNYRLR